MAELVARGIDVDRGRIRALSDVHLQLHAGELLVVMGGTGAGKSTLALALAGLLPTTGGSVEGAAVGRVRMVLQRPESTFLADTVAGDIALASLARGEPRVHAAARAAALLAELALSPDLAARDPLALSGGEQRRVAIAATLAADPRVLVLDEPSAGLDRAARAELHAALRRLHAAGRTIVLVTHDPDEAANLATRLLVVRGGRVVHDGDPAEVLGAPALAATLGLAVSPEVELLHRVATARGVAVTGIHRAGDALDALVRLPTASTAPAPPGGDAGAVREAVPVVSAPVILPDLVDARVRVVACAVAVVAALVATSLAAAAVVALASAVVVAAARIGRARVRLAVRPLVALLALLVALQWIVGATHEVAVAPGLTTDHPAAAAVLRALQATAVVLATLALSGATAVTDLATALRRLLAPLGLLRVPIGSGAFVVATGLGLVPVLADELERLRLAQRARGIRALDASWLAALRADTALVPSLFVAAFRRAHLLADALAVRGVDPDHQPHDWRARRTPVPDLLLLAVAAALLVVARLA